MSDTGTAVTTESDMSFVQLWYDVRKGISLDVRDAEPYPDVLLASVPCAVRMSFESWRPADGGCLHALPIFPWSDVRIVKHGVGGCNGFSGA